ncbi:formate/nitrite transporter family protein [Microbulbifer rhizosphaerae]|uniref:Formate/nitrite transporter FocA (FNT family) n=1 Tax=Microbulbifer rhizosphaerae TaxID=1562603 RepID=A0A7W4WC65_9GAMM|nr:formate/nitrite transporter family protein [Microbulbifer rhizosphaerae]MBB3061561.1 formate/nitrite transporter FocA (FNT family) [Microbulbifer rhizosphaerae]
MSSESDKPKKDREILQEQMEASLHEYERDNRSLFLSSIAAGLEIGFSFFLMAAFYTHFYTQVDREMLYFITSLSYPIGFVMVIIGRSDLFTEHTTLAILPVLDGRQRWRSLGRIWSVIYAGNMLGAMIFSLIFVRFVALSQHIDGGVFDYYEAKMVVDSDSGMFLGAIFAGWLMGLLGWVVTSSSDTIGRIVVISVITFLIGFGGLAHCIAGAVAIFSAWFGTEGGVGIVGILRFLGLATLGNIVGGSIFVGLLKYGYIATSKQR